MPRQPAICTCQKPTGAGAGCGHPRCRGAPGLPHHMPAIGKGFGLCTNKRACAAAPAVLRAAPQHGHMRMAPLKGCAPSAPAHGGMPLRRFPSCEPPALPCAPPAVAPARPSPYLPFDRHWLASRGLGPQMPGCPSRTRARPCTLGAHFASTHASAGNREFPGSPARPSPAPTAGEGLLPPRSAQAAQGGRPERSAPYNECPAQPEEHAHAPGTHLHMHLWCARGLHSPSTAHCTRAGAPPKACPGPWRL